MKIIKDVVVEAQPTHIIKKEMYICDICGKERQYVTTCVICGKHLCVGTNERCYINDPDCFGDYPDHYCLICYDLRFKKYVKEIDQIELEADKKKELIIQRIKEESLTVINYKN